MLTVRMYVPTLANCVCKQRLAHGAEIAAGADHRPWREARAWPMRPASLRPASTAASRRPAATAGPRRAASAARRRTRPATPTGSRPPGPSASNNQRLPARPSSRTRSRGWACCGKTSLAGRIGRVVTQQGRRQKNHRRQQRQCQQVEFQVAVFEHVRLLGLSIDKVRVCRATRARVPRCLPERYERETVASRTTGITRVGGVISRHGRPALG